VFDRFTESARQVVVKAQEEAQMMRHGRIGTEHLLVALADVPPLGMTRARARSEVVKAVGLGDEADAGGSIPMTPAAQEALETSLNEAMKLGQERIEPGHILLGIIRQRDGVAVRVLAAAGHPPRELREAVIAELTREQADDAVVVRLGREAIGDLGSFRTDVHLLLAILGRGGPVAAWLRERGVTDDALRRML
jgi:ATP-dependent Clp protease ATP-binding subunit ClpC